MPPVGRPRVSTRQGARPPVNQIGVADPFNFGVSVNPANGQLANWRQFIDIYEDVPELMWPQSITTLDHMRTDSQLAALLTSVIYGITQLRYIIDPNGARASLVKEISEDLNLPVKGKDDQPLGRMKKRFSHHKFASQAMLAAIYGHMYFEQNGEIVDGKWRLRKMFSIMPRTIARINVEDDGGLVNVVQWAGRNFFGQQNYSPMFGTAEPIPVDRLTAFVFNQEGYNWHGRSMMRDCFKDWTIKDRLLRVEAINHERAGGIPYGVAPQGATPTDIDDISQMMQQFRIGETAGGAVPFGTEIKIARGTGSEINNTIMRYDQSMARRFLLMLANLAQGGQHVGSYALGETFEDFFLVGQRAIAQWYCDVVNEHIIEDIADWNYDGEDLVPKLTWERTTEDSLGTTDLALLVQRGIIIVDEELENAIRFKYQLPKRSTPRPPETVGPGIGRQPQELLPGETKPPTGEVPETTTPPPGEAPTTTQAKGAGEPSGAPSSDSPAKASFFHRFRRKPDVMAKQDGPVLVTVPNVEILHAGVEYNLSTGPTTFTLEDLQDVVMAANEDPSIPNPRLGIGHIDPRYNDITVFDGDPSFGKATNLRLSENGTSVYADYVGVPKWLAEIMPTAFPSRSIEGFWGVQSQMGKKYRFVLSACKLLGVQWPGVTVLEDLPQYYGAEMPSDIVLDPALVAATGGDPMRLFGKKDTAASANLDDVRRAFYSEYVPEHASEGTMWWWIQAILVDPNELVVEDDETGKLYKIDFSSDTDGGISFGDAAPVRIEYIPDTRDANKAAAAHVAATLAVGREVLASWDNREESLPATASGGAMDPKEIRKRLGLSEDASDDQVKDALRELNTAAGVEPEAPAPATAPPAAAEPAKNEPVTPAAPAAPAAQTAAEPVAVAASGLPAGTVLVDEGQWGQMVAASTEASEFVKRQKERERNELVAAAIGDGRIAPASKEHWEKYLETDPGAPAVLASLKPGLIPVELRGNAGNGTEGTDPVAAALGPEVVETWTDQLFPEVRDWRANERARAAGQPVSRSRVTADAAYRR